MKGSFWLVVITILMGTAALGQKNSLQAKSLKNRAGWNFNPKSSATQGDWSYFKNMTSEAKQKLWRDWQKRKVDLKGWHWTWRQAWVRSCAAQWHSYCGRLLVQGLYDQAMVVRVAAVRAIGEIYKGSSNDFVAETLLKTYNFASNSRNGKPLSIKNEILYALFKINSRKYKSQIKYLASSHPKTAKYYKKLF